MSRSEEACNESFQAIDIKTNNEVNIYTLTISETKATVFQLVRCHVVWDMTFQITSNSIGAAYSVLAKSIATGLRCPPSNKLCFCSMSGKLSVDVGSTSTSVDIIH